MGERSRIRSFRFHEVIVRTRRGATGGAEAERKLAKGPIGEAPGLAAIGLGLILLLTMIARPNGLSGGRDGAGETACECEDDAATWHQGVVIVIEPT